MSISRLWHRRWTKLVSLAVMPLVLYLAMYKQMEWKPIVLGQPVGSPHSAVRVAFSPDGKWLAIVGDTTAELWDTANWSLVQKKSTTGYIGEGRVKFSPDSSMLAVCHANRSVQLWDLKHLVTLRSLPPQLRHQSYDSVTFLDFSPDGTLLAAGGDEMLVDIWNIQTGKIIRQLSQPQGQSGLAFSPDGKTLAITDNFGWGNPQVRLIDVSTGNLRFALVHRSMEALTDVAYAPDGKLLAVGCEDSTIVIWNGQSNQLRQTLSGHTRSVARVSFSADGKLLVSGSRDGTVKLWDPIQGRLLRTLQSGTDRVTSIAISPASATLAAGYANGTARLWRIK